MNFNGAQIHLFLNHVPVIVFPMGLLLLVWGRSRKDAGILRAGLGMLVLAALATLPAFWTGEPAEHVVKNLADYQKGSIHPHEEAAEASLVAVLAAGSLALGLIGPWAGRLPERARAWGLSGLMALALVATGALGWTAHLGGLIRHPEIRPTQGLALGSVGENHVFEQDQHDSDD